jgi:hypothetical protein
MSDEPRQVAKSAKGVPLALWPLLAIVLLTIGWVIVEVHDADDKTTVVTAKRDLPAYHRIAAGDLTTDEVDGKGPKDALKDKAKLPGTVTRKALAKGAKLVKDDLTKAVDERAFKGVRLRLHPRQSTTSGVELGDTVSLYLAPTSDSEAMAPASIPALLIDANGKQGAGGQQVVIVEPNRVEELLRLVGRADLMITPGSRSPF